MTTLRHPHIYPPLEIQVDDARVEDHLRAGWLLAEETPAHERLAIEAAALHLNPDSKPPARNTNRSKP